MIPTELACEILWNYKRNFIINSKICLEESQGKKLLIQIGLDTSAYRIPFSRLMMGLNLCNRFIHFEEWFSREIIKERIRDIGEIADRVFAVR